MATQLNKTQTNFFKEQDFNQKDEKNSTSTEHKNQFKTNSKLGAVNWPKIKELSNEPKIFVKTNQKFNLRSIYTGDPVKN